jgi:hypothetical protein
MKAKFAILRGLSIGVAALLLNSPAQAAIEYVKVCDTYGPQFVYIPGTATCLNVDTGETITPSGDGPVHGETTLKQQAEDAAAGAAVAISMPNATVDEGKTFGLSTNYGVYGDSSALGISGAFKPTDGLTINAGAGFSTAGGPAGGRVGVNFSW